MNPAKQFEKVAPFRCRPDLEFNETSGDYDDAKVVVKDPLSQKYFHLTRNVLFILQQLDGKTSLLEVRRRYLEKFSPHRIELHRLESLVLQLHRDGLASSVAQGQGQQLFQRQQKHRETEMLQNFSNVLAIRFRGVDPDRMLDVTNRFVGWMFSRYCVVAMLAVSSVVLAMVVVRLPQLAHDMPKLNAFFQFENLAIFFAVFSLTKILHEFGHGIACKRLGGECHEIGFMLLVMTPCLYCNVSDSWLLKNKWHRAAIGAAGMYVEMILATVAAIAWMNSSEGWVQMVALQVMILCSISTVVFNGNPLLRFDGYFILSDLLEIPNLMQRSSAALKNTLGKTFLGFQNRANDVPEKNRIVFACYAVSSSVYRWLILVSIVWFLCTWLEPKGLKSLGVAVAVAAVFGMLAWPLTRAIKFLRVPGRVQQFNLVRGVCFSLIVASLASGAMLIPLPHYVHCDVVLMPDKMQVLFAHQPGVMEQVLVSPGQWVNEGDLIIRTRNDELQLKKLDVESQLQQARLDRRYLLGAGIHQTWKPDRLATTEARIASLTSILNSVETQQETQEFVAKIDGRVTAVHSVVGNHGTGQGRRAGKLEIQSETLLDEKNLGAFIERGTRICEVVDDQSWNAILLIDAGSVDFVREGQEASIRLVSNPFSDLSGTIESIGTSDRLLRASGMQGSTNFSESSGPTLVESLVARRKLDEVGYLAMARVTSPSERIRVGSGGTARLYCGRSSLGWRLTRYLSTHFQ